MIQLQLQLFIISSRKNCAVLRCRNIVVFQASSLSDFRGPLWLNVFLRPLLPQKWINMEAFSYKIINQAWSKSYTFYQVQQRTGCQYYLCLLKLIFPSAIYKPAACSALSCQLIKLLSHEVYSLNPSGLQGIDPSGLEHFLVGDWSPWTRPTVGGGLIPLD